MSMKANCFNGFSLILNRVFDKFKQTIFKNFVLRAETFHFSSENIIDYKTSKK